MARRLILGATATLGSGGVAVALLKKAETKEADAPQTQVALDISKDGATRSGQLQRAIQRSTRIIERFRAEMAVAGVAVGVSVNGKTVFSRGFGYSNLEQLSACTEDTRMRVGSISKPITAALVARLVDQGLIQLDEPIQKYLPDFPEKQFDGKPVTITTRQLLSHTSGIRHYGKVDKSVDMEADDGKSAFEAAYIKEFFRNTEYKTVSDSMEIFKDDPLVDKPGNKKHYTSYGFVLLSRIIESVTNDTFPNQLKQMCQNLSMQSTDLDENRPLIAEKTRPYEFNDGRLMNSPEVNNSYKWAGGGLVSTVGDLLLFGNAHLYSLQCGQGSLLSNNKGSCPHKALLKCDTVAQFWSPACEGADYGLGWAVKPAEERLGSVKAWNGKGFVSHGGSSVGATSCLLVKPADSIDETITPPIGTCVAVLTNLQLCPGVDRLAMDLAKEFAALEYLE